MSRQDGQRGLTEEGGSIWLANAQAAVTVITAVAALVATLFKERPIAVTFFIVATVVGIAFTAYKLWNAKSPNNVVAHPKVRVIVVVALAASIVVLAGSMLKSSYREFAYYELLGVRDGRKDLAIGQISEQESESIYRTEIAVQNKSSERRVATSIQLSIESSGYGTCGSNQFFHYNYRLDQELAVSVLEYPRSGVGYIGRIREFESAGSSKTKGTSNVNFSKMATFRKVGETCGPQYLSVSFPITALLEPKNITNFTIELPKVLTTRGAGREEGKIYIENFLEAERRVLGLSSRGDARSFESRYSIEMHIGEEAVPLKLSKSSFFVIR